MNRPDVIKNRPPGLIAEFRGAKPPAPDWFESAIAHQPERAFVKAAGTDIETLAWGERGKPGLLFLHGNGANAHWWSHIAPMFAPDFRVTAFSMAGMGNSQWRAAYRYDEFVDDALAVIDATGLRDAPLGPVVIGHSFGSFISSGIAARAEARLRAAIYLDGPWTDSFYQQVRANYVVRPRNIYPSIEDALMRFRFIPEQDCDNPFIIDWIARTALARVTGEDGKEGWSWSADPSFWKIFEGGSPKANFKKRNYPVAFIDAARGRYAMENAARHWLPDLQPNAPIITIPNSHHHIMADEPLALMAALTSLFAAWPPLVA